MTSIADMQWVLHHLPNTDTQAEVETSVSGKQIGDAESRLETVRLFLASLDVERAASISSMGAPLLDAEARTKLGVPESHTALEVRWINIQAVGRPAMFR